jgi:hypothetical protein
MSQMQKRLEARGEASLAGYDVQLKRPCCIKASIRLVLLRKGCTASDNPDRMLWAGPSR